LFIYEYHVGERPSAVTAPCGPIRWLKRMHPQMKAIPMWYVVMLLLSVLLGYVVSRFCSEPLNRQLRSPVHGGYSSARTIA
jgi:peptidoglycan/LPS O-acetylase OafA/YrhL